MVKAARDRVLSRNWRAHVKHFAGLDHDTTIGFVGSFTIDSLIDYVGGQLLEAGTRNPRLLNAGYNQLMAVCQDPERAFSGVTPNVIVILWRIEDLADPGQPHLVRAALEMLLAGVRKLRVVFGGTIVLALPPRP